MALNYGYTAPNNTKLDELNLKITALANSTDVILKNKFHYHSIGGGGYLLPFSLVTGYPCTQIYAHNTNERSKITLLTHIFDNDNTITTLRVRYRLVCTLNDGTIFAVNLKNEIDLEPKRIGTLNYYNLNETFVIKDYVPRFKDIELMMIKIKRRGVESYGNESVLTVLSYTTL